jgi:hypothetical protein
MKLYAYIPREDGTEPTGSEKQWLLSHQTIAGAIKAICKNKTWGESNFIIKGYTNFYDEKTFKHLYTHNFFNK